MGTTRTNRPAPWAGLLGGLALALALALGATPVTATVEALDAIVAVVNDDVIVQSELEREIELILPQMQRAGTAAPPRPQLEKQVLDRLILKRLQRQRARDLGIEVDEATLIEALSDIAARNGLTLPELQATLEAGGIDFADFREDTRAQILTSRLQRQEVVSKIRITDQEIDRFLEREASLLIDRERVRLQHILIALPEQPDAEQVARAERKAKQLVVKLRGGADFAALAARDSDGRNALQGGDLGWFEIGATPTLVADLALTLNEGEISDPIRSSSGYHIIKLTAIEGAKPGNLQQTHVRHILIRTNELVSDADAKRRLGVLRQRILGGDDFALLARANSDDTGSALRGGDLGWVNPGDTVPAFEEVMNGLGPNQLSAPFQSPFGWHLVQVLERRTQDSAEGAMRIKAREALQQRKAEEAIELWLRQLRDEAYIEIRLDDLDD
ncbi:peptidylprolyl isomerase [Marichromatium bheemlicum]|uniref:Chaperone SurA n=1 Tax=Marichromatium bheemlicum TaxID=365339 RepID=A0ABX1I9L6_9GAMM|nr:peptidylprolyl isomerase [Marichromatium bheemlicum]NKN32880.1 molecular chaperone SurA [Marichromatium bheemlicum]